MKIRIRAANSVPNGLVSSTSGLGPRGGMRGKMARCDISIARPCCLRRSQCGWVRWPHFNWKSGGVCATNTEARDMVSGCEPSPKVQVTLQASTERRHDTLRHMIYDRPFFQREVWQDPQIQMLSLQADLSQIFETPKRRGCLLYRVDTTPKMSLRRGSL